MPAGCACGNVFRICARMLRPCVVLQTAIFSPGRIKAVVVNSLWRSRLPNTGVVAAVGYNPTPPTRLVTQTKSMTAKCC